jgi:hypothetical protein
MSQEMAEVSGAETLLLEILGLRFLAYVLNVDEATLNARLQGGQQLAPMQEAALRELISFLGTISQDPVNAEHPALRSISLSVLGEFRPELGRSWVSATRIATGARDDVPTGRGDLNTSLIAIATDVYPLCLLPQADDDHFGFRFGPSLTTPVFRHPQTEVFQAAVMQDATLKRLFPEENEQSGRYGTVHRSTGMGGGIQLSMLAPGLLENAWQAATQIDSDVSLAVYVRAALQQLDAIQRAVQGKRMTVKALVGVTGLRLPENVSVDLPWGRLRGVTESDRRLVPPGLGGQLNATTEDGQQITIDYAGDVVMEMDVPYKIKFGDVQSVEGWPTDLVSQEMTEQRLETLRLALLLSTRRSAQPIALGTWSVYLDPLAIGGHGSSWRDPRKARPLMPIALSKAEANKWGEWIRLIDERRVKNIDVAIRRTLFATADRLDPNDGLVDAVIALENLVGSRQGEPTLRIATALAWLLGRNATERQEIRSQVNALYKTRSDIVHGGPPLNPQEIHEKYQEALDIAIRALRAIFRNRAELLSECKDSTERSLRLILHDRAVRSSEGTISHGKRRKHDRS